ncbi:hypothetical protein [Streptomyces sp. NBC_00197]|uniref:hypothetical protein n=1 Tax=Streptomyces sp. NBC_00197 TaxID=2975676 RepID=UPI00324FD8B9
MPEFPTQLGVSYDEVEAKPTVNRRGERTITVSVTRREGDHWSSSSSTQLDMLAAAQLVNDLTLAIHAHYFDHITPKAPSEVL